MGTIADRRGEARRGEAINECELATSISRLRSRERLGQAAHRAMWHPGTRSPTHDDQPKTPNHPYADNSIGWSGQRQCAVHVMMVDSPDDHA